MTASLDWRDDASLPAGIAGRGRTLVVVFLATAFVAVTGVLAARSMNEAASSACRLYETARGAPALEKLDVPGVGQQVPPGWLPPHQVRVSYVTTDAYPRGTVIDETSCGQAHDRLLVSVSR